MTQKTFEQMARDTLNALIVGRYVPASLLEVSSGKAVLDADLLRSIEDQLREYYAEPESEQKQPPGRMIVDLL